MAALAFLLGLGGILVAVELLLRLFVTSPSLTCGWEPTSSPQGQRNQLGTRGRFLRKKPDRFVVLLLGDSQVVAEAMSFGKMPSRLLQQQLHLQGQTQVEVRSLAGVGWGQAEQLLALRRYFRKGFRADLVVLWFTRENDVWNNIFPGAWGHPHLPKPTYWLSGTKLKGPLCQRHTPPPRWHLQRWWRAARRKNIDRRWTGRLPKASVPVSVSKRSLPIGKKLATLRKAGHWPARDEQPFFNKSHWLLRLTPRSPRILYGIRLTHRLLREIEKETLRQKARFLLFTAEPALGTRYLFGTNFKSLELWDWQGKIFRTSFRQWDENWQELSNGFRTLSLTLTTRNWRVSRLDAHLNETANREAMRLLAQQLRGFVTGKKRNRHSLPFHR